MIFLLPAFAFSLTTIPFSTANTHRLQKSVKPILELLGPISEHLRIQSLSEETFANSIYIELNQIASSSDDKEHFDVLISTVENNMRRFHNDFDHIQVNIRYILADMEKRGLNKKNWERVQQVKKSMDLRTSRLSVAKLDRILLRLQLAEPELKIAAGKDKEIKDVFDAVMASKYRLLDATKDKEEISIYIAGKGKEQVEQFVQSLKELGEVVGLKNTGNEVGIGLLVGATAAGATIAATKLSEDENKKGEAQQ